MSETHSKNSTPLVSVLLPVYNCENYILESINSILKQTYTNFELVIVNDGSTDNTGKIIKSFSDPRIVYVNNGDNKGLIYSLNYGISVCHGIYIVRMDADDISLTNRIEKQVRFMESNNNFIISGCYADFFGEGVKGYIRKLPTNTKSIRSYNLFSSAFIHPSVIIRANVLKNEFRYQEDYIGAEDFALWGDIIDKYDSSNINEVLLKYRVLDDSVTAVESSKVAKRFYILNSIYKKNLLKLGDFSDDEVALFTCLCNINFLKKCDKCGDIICSNVLLLFNRIKFFVRANSNYDYELVVKLLSIRIVIYCIVTRKMLINKMMIVGIFEIFKKRLVKMILGHVS